MSGKAKRLERLLAVRQLTEELDRRQMQMANAAVFEVKVALEEQRSAMIDADRASRAALENGERGEWLLAEAQNEVAGWNRSRLAVVFQKREAEVPPVLEQFQKSRLEREQAKLLVDAAKMAARLDEDRREQAVVDDWFLSRLASAHKKPILNDV